MKHVSGFTSYITFAAFGLDQDTGLALELLWTFTDT